MKTIGNSGVQVSDFIYGCWQMGGDYWGEVEDAKAQELARYAIDRGVTTFDTAFVYGQGRAEESLAAALHGIDRVRYELISKLWMKYLSYDGTLAACEASLARLGTDYMDIYFIHYPDRTGTMPIARTMEALNLLKRQGKIRAIGVSNFSLRQLKEAREYGEIDMIQPCYNLAWRFIDKRILGYCRENNIAVTPYSALAQGLLTGSFTLEKRPESDGRRVSALCMSPYYEGVMGVTDEVLAIAKKYGVSAANVALYWIMHKEGVTAPIVGISEQRDVDELRLVKELHIDATDLARLEEVSQLFAYKLPFFQSLFEPKIVSDPDEEAE